MAERLEERRPEIEEAVIARVHAVSDPAADGDAEYLQGLRTAVVAAVGYGLQSIECGEERSGPVPLAMLAQARQAARNRVSLDTVLRRYFAGYTAMGDFLMQEGRQERVAIPGAMLYRLQKELAALFDRLVVAVSAEYRQETEQAMRPLGLRSNERMKRILAGELVDTAELDYDFEAWHLGIIASGPGAESLLRELASAHDRRLLLGGAGEATLWAWLGGRQRLDPKEITWLPMPQAVSLSIGEPGHGLRGWRLSHRQAETALSVALRRPKPLTFYADVALLASVLRDDDLVAFITDSYLSPLSAERDGGATLCRTLRAYFVAGHNVASAAAALGVSRQTVTSRLRVVEERIGRPLGTCRTEMEAALQLADIGSVLDPALA